MKQAARLFGGSGGIQNLGKMKACRTRVSTSLTASAEFGTRRCELPIRLCGDAAREHFRDGELAIGAVWNHGLTRLKMKLFAIELHRDNVRLE